MYSGSWWIQKTAYGRIFTASSWRPYCRKKRQIHYSITIWFTNSFLCSKPWKSQQHKLRWTRNGKIGQNFGVEPDKSQRLERSDRWSKDDGCKSSFCITDGHMSFEKCRNGDKRTKIQRSSCTLWWYCKKRFWVFLQYSLNKDLQHLKWQPPKSWISSPDCQVVQDKQQTQYQLIRQVKMEDAHKLLKIPKSECPDIWIRLTHDTNGQNHGPAWQAQSFLLSEICRVILWQDYYGKGNLRKSC